MAGEDLLKRYIQQAPKLIGGVAGKVYAQLLPDYPIKAIEWVKQVHWEGPLKIPLHMVDFSQRMTWRASHELDHVQKHMQLIQEGDTIPVILVLAPGHDKFECIDGHHRLLAYEALKRPILAYIAYVPNDKPDAPWMTMHEQQYTGDSKLKLDGTAGEVAGG